MASTVVFLFVSVLVTFGVRGSCSPSIGNDNFEDLINVMVKVKCQQSVSQPSLQPAFFATLTKTVSLGMNAVLKLDLIVTNIGNGYDPNSGVFIVGKSGLYEFAASFISNDDNWLELNLMKTNEFLVKGHSGKYSRFTSGHITSEERRQIVSPESP